MTTEEQEYDQGYEDAVWLDELSPQQYAYYQKYLAMTPEKLAHWKERLTQKWDKNASSPKDDHELECHLQMIIVAEREHRHLSSKHTRDVHKINDDRAANGLFKLAEDNGGFPVPQKQGMPFHPHATDKVLDDFVYELAKQKVINIDDPDDLNSRNEVIQTLRTGRQQIPFLGGPSLAVVIAETIPLSTDRYWQAWKEAFSNKGRPFGRKPGKKASSDKAKIIQARLRKIFKR